MRSGVVSRSLPPGASTSFIISRFCRTVSVESMCRAVTPLSRIFSTWSLMSAMSGETTTVRPGRTIDGSW